MNDSMRIKSIDYAKAIVIFLVVVGHTPVCPNGLKQIIYTFHMPAFFAFYGMTWKNSRQSFTDDIKKKSLRLFVPYLFWAYLYVFIFGVCRNSFRLKHLLFVLYGSQASLRLSNSLTSLWYITCFMLAALFFDLIMNQVNSKTRNNFRIKSISILLFVFFVLGVVASKVKILEVGYPWNFNIVPMAIFFILVGYCMKEFLHIMKNMRTISAIAVCIVSVGFLICTYKYNLSYILINNVDMASGNYGHPAWFLLNSIVGIVLVMMCGGVIEKIGCCEILEYIGKNTLTILFIHKPFVQFCSNMVGVGINNNINRYFTTIIISVIAVMFCCFCSYFLNNYAPELIGMPRKQSKKTFKDS